MNIFFVNQTNKIGKSFKNWAKVQNLDTVVRKLLKIEVIPIIHYVCVWQWQTGLHYATTLRCYVTGVAMTIVSKLKSLFNDEDIVQNCRSKSTPEATSVLFY